MIPSALQVEAAMPHLTEMIQYKLVKIELATCSAPIRTNSIACETQPQWSVDKPDVTKRTAFDWRGELNIYKALYRFTLRLLHKPTLSSRMKYMIPYDT